MEATSTSRRTRSSFRLLESDQARQPKVGPHDAGHENGATQRKIANGSPLGVTIATWAQCDHCSKWRKLSAGTSIIQTASFSCSDVEGYTCDVPEEPEVEASQTDDHSAGISDAAPSSATRRVEAGSHRCLTCGAVTTTLEHYGANPLCRVAKYPNGKVSLSLSVTQTQTLVFACVFFTRARACIRGRLPESKTEQPVLLPRRLVTLVKEWSNRQ